MCVCYLYAIPVICVYLPHKEPSLREEILYGISSMWNLKRNNTNEFTYKTQTDSETSISSLWLFRRMRRAIREVWGRIDTWVCMAESLCHSPQTTTTLLPAISQYKIKSLKKNSLGDFGYKITLKIGFLPLD